MRHPRASRRSSARRYSQRRAPGPLQHYYERFPNLTVTIQVSAGEAARAFTNMADAVCTMAFSYSSPFATISPEEARACAAARERARALLREHLTPEQQNEAVGGAFHVRSADGKRVYRISLIRDAYNVTLAQSSSPVFTTDGVRLTVGTDLCAVPEERMPKEDRALAQMLMLQSEEGERKFLRVANTANL